jgi:hypothetical protein
MVEETISEVEMLKAALREVVEENAILKSQLQLIIMREVNDNVENDQRVLLPVEKAAADQEGTQDT